MAYGDSAVVETVAAAMAVGGGEGGMAPALKVEVVQEVEWMAVGMVVQELTAGGGGALASAAVVAGALVGAVTAAGATAEGATAGATVEEETVEVARGVAKDKAVMVEVATAVAMVVVAMVEVVMGGAKVDETVATVGAVVATAVVATAVASVEGRGERGACSTQNTGTQAERADRT